MQGLNEAPSRADIYLRRARKGRVTGWTVLCRECGDVGNPAKDRTVEAAKRTAGRHALGQHAGAARIHYVPAR